MKALTKHNYYMIGNYKNAKVTSHKVFAHSLGILLFLWLPNVLLMKDFTTAF
jgi:hypothetical protein